MNTRIRNLSASCLLVAATISGVSGAYAAEFTAKIGHLESAQQSRHVHLEKVAELVAERTGGAVEFQVGVFFHEGLAHNRLTLVCSREREWPYCIATGKVTRLEIGYPIHTDRSPTS